MALNTIQMYIFNSDLALGLRICEASCPPSISPWVSPNRHLRFRLFPPSLDLPLPRLPHINIWQPLSTSSIARAIHLYILYSSFPSYFISKPEANSDLPATKTHLKFTLLSPGDPHLVRTLCFLMCTVEVSSEPISPFLLHLIQSLHRSPSNCFKMWIKLLPECTSGKEPACQCRRCKRYVFNTWIRKIPWSRTWQPTPVLLARESYGQRSLVGYSPWGRKGSDTTEVT